MSSLTLTQPRDPAMVPRMDTTFSYDQVETALASVFSVPDDKRKALKARLRHFTNLGLAPEGRPGKGRRIRYTFEDAVRWTVALELAHFGFNPQDIAEFLQKTRGSFRRVIWLMLRDLVDGELRRNIVAIIKVAPLFDESSPKIQIKFTPRNRLNLDTDVTHRAATFSISGCIVRLLLHLINISQAKPSELKLGLLVEAAGNVAGDPWVEEQEALYQDLQPETLKTA
jgi:hypothetical protein